MRIPLDLGFPVGVNSKWRELTHQSAACCDGQHRYHPNPQGMNDQSLERKIGGPVHRVTRSFQLGYASRLVRIHRVDQGTHVPMRERTADMAPGGVSFDAGRMVRDKGARVA